MKYRFEAVSRLTTPRGMGIITMLFSLVAGLFVIGIIFALKGINPFFAIGRIFGGSFGTMYGLKETITKAIPLILIGGGLTVAFRGKFWNIGAESQLLMGATTATYIGLTWGASLPPWSIISIMLITGFLAGAVWGIIPAFMRARLGINEVISTLMLNYIAAEIIKYLVVGPWKGKTKFGFPYTDNLPPNAIFKLIPGSRIHYLTLIIAVLSVLILFIVLYRTKFGYEVRVVGENQEAAKYAGINFTKTTLLIMVISGGVAGLAGVGELAGLHHHLSYPETISAGYGFTAIIVAWLAKLNPLFVLISGLFFAGILVGGDAIQISLGLPAATVHIFNGILLVFLIIGEFFLNNRVVIKREEPWN